MPKHRDDHTTCIVQNCNKPVVTYTPQLCTTHYQKFKKEKKDWDAPLRKIRIKQQQCIATGCTRQSVSHVGYCPKHYRRWKQYNDPYFIKINERGSGCKSADGYIKIYDLSKKRVVGQHRLVMEKILRRELFPDEEVHHKNGIRDDNRESNLEL